ncbi:hypothetical protein [Trichloromonas sp.]|uniref:hypothetical protein n=1 Tax=Trichloromonas sp. TaxID=3069249 RepID=UPI003D814B56
MFCPLLKYAAPLVLLFALVSLSGAASVAAAFSGSPATDACCGQEADRQAPASEGECVDPGCFCPLCNVPILNSLPLPVSSAREPDPSLCGLATGPSSGFSRCIDYPPEPV